MKKTIKFAELFNCVNSNSNETEKRLIIRTLAKVEREFNVNFVSGTGELRQARRDDEYIGKEIPCSAEGLRHYMGVFATSQVPGMEFNFFRMEVACDPSYFQVWKEMVEWY